MPAPKPTCGTPFEIRGFFDYESLSEPDAFHRGLVKQFTQSRKTADTVCATIGGACSKLEFIRYIEFRAIEMSGDIQWQLTTEWKCVEGDGGDTPPAQSDDKPDLKISTLCGSAFRVYSRGEHEPVDARRAFHLALIDAWDNAKDIAEKICKEIGGDCRTLMFVRYIEFLPRPIGDKLQVDLITEWKCIVADSNGGGSGAILDGDIPKPECGALFAVRIGLFHGPADADNAFHLGLVEASARAKERAEDICKLIGGDCRKAVFIRCLEFHVWLDEDENKLAVNLTTQWKCVDAAHASTGDSSELDMSRLCDERFIVYSDGSSDGTSAVSFYDALNKAYSKSREVAKKVCRDIGGDCGALQFVRYVRFSRFPQEASLLDSGLTTLSVWIEWQCHR